MDAASRPRLKSYLEPVVGIDDGLLLLSEGRHAWLKAPVFAALAPLLDGAHEVEAIFDALARDFPPEQIVAALVHLRSAGYLADDVLTEADTAETRGVRAFWEQVGVPPSLARSRLERARVATLAIGNVELDGLTDLLERGGVKVGREGDITQVVTDDYLHPELAQWNERSLAAGKPWLLVKPVGIETWIGPLFVPGQTACWECLAQRLRGHRKVERYIARRRGIETPVASPRASMCSTQHAPLAESATEIMRWIATGGQSRLLERVVSTCVLTLERTHHALTRRPQCPACGSPRANDDGRPKPLSLHRRPKLHASDGGHRAHDCRAVLARLERHVSPITGLVGTLTPGERTSGSGGERVTPIFVADHNFSDIHDDRFFLREGLRRRSGGKGMSSEQARASALGESIERYCGVFDGTEPRMRAAFTKLGNAAVHPNLCMGYSERQYAAREERNRKGHKAHWVPEPFREDIEIEWSPLWSLTAEQTRYLPTSFCYYGYRSSDPVFARADSNGCAAGAELEEAVLQGLLELIERDAVALWWYNRLRRPGVDLASADDPYISALTRHYGELRREVWALDVTSDLGVPAFAAISRRLDQVEEDIIYGFGAHLDPRVALARALTELNQSLEAVPAATGPDSARTYRGGEEAVHWWRTVKAADCGYLTPDPATPLRVLQDIKDLSSDDLCEEIHTCKTAAAAKGIEILVLDQTRPDVGLPVVRVVAPGLRHFWARFGPGRLYDVPVREGWLSRSLGESELNPHVIQF
jgi:ribosomal protein S12 methylthiotransferase accessory factor